MVGRVVVVALQVKVFIRGLLQASPAALARGPTTTYCHFAGGGGRTDAISLSMMSTASSSITVCAVMLRIAAVIRVPSSARTILPEDCHKEAERGRTLNRVEAIICFVNPNLFIFAVCSLSPLF